MLVFVLVVVIVIVMVMVIVIVIVVVIVMVIVIVIAVVIVMVIVIVIVMSGDGHDESSVQLSHLPFNLSSILSSILYDSYAVSLLSCYALSILTSLYPLLLPPLLILPFILLLPLHTAVE